MTIQPNDAFNEGYQFSDTDPEQRDGYFFSQRDPDFCAGYIVRQAEGESLRAAYPDGYALSCAHLAVQYNLAPEHLHPHIADDDRSIFENAYRDVLDASIEEDDEDLF